MPLQIIRQDIVKIKCDAVVNPSNTKLFPTGGTDAAIHNAAGEELFYACRKIGGIETGEAVITPGFKLPAKYVIHTAGPEWNGGAYGETELLENCYRNVLKLAKENGCKSIAMPLISSGLYGFPKDQVLKTALRTVSDFLFYNEMMVYLVVYDKKAYEFSEKLFSHIEQYIDDHYVLHHSDNHRDNEYLISTYADAKAIRPSMALRCEAMPEESCGPEPLFVSEETSPPEKSLEEYIYLDEGFALKLMRLIDLKGMNDVHCYKKANVSKQTWYKIMNDKGYKPNKKTVISFAIALELTLSEAQSLLGSVGFILSNSSLSDVIIMYCLTYGIYDVFEIDSILYKYDQETLFS